MEGEKSGRMEEGWKRGWVEEGKDGRVEGWKRDGEEGRDGWKEGWKGGGKDGRGDGGRKGRGKEGRMEEGGRREEMGYFTLMTTSVISSSCGLPFAQELLASNMCLIIAFGDLSATSVKSSFVFG